MEELFFRTEDLRLDEVLANYVATPGDEDIVRHLKRRSPVLLKGSRGVGKSFLLKVAEGQLKRRFADDRVLPVYLTFAKASLVNKGDNDFLPWMISKITSAMRRAVTAYGLEVPADSSLSGLVDRSGKARDESIAERAEEFWSSHTGAPEDVERLPDSDTLKESIQDLCEALDIRRIVLLIDEAAHVFIPSQQREFFTLMRDLRSPYVAVKAAVYPGATSYGETFQPVHDAQVLELERFVGEKGYIAAMREILLRRAGDNARLGKHGEELDVLAFAATGNPRVLLKTYAAASPFNRKTVGDAIRTYYREAIWAEHSNLAERYPGHKVLIDWGRKFIEVEVIPAVRAKNDGAVDLSSAFWIHRDSPQVVREALRLLSYSGIVVENQSGVKATRSEPGTRYILNLGCNIAWDPEVVQYGTRLRQSLDIRRMAEFGANHPAYKELERFDLEALAESSNAALISRMEASIDVLDITEFQRQKLRELQLGTIKEVLEATEEDFKTLYYVGDVRARQMRNAAVTAVIEFVSG